MPELQLCLRSSSALTGCITHLAPQVLGGLLIFFVDRAALPHSTRPAVFTNLYNRCHKDSQLYYQRNKETSDDLALDIRRCGKSCCEKRKNHQKTTIVREGFHRKTPWFWQTDHNYSMESAKHWELPGEELGTGTRRSENHLNGGIDCISSFVLHSNWGSKSTKFDNLLKEKRSKSMLLKTLQHMSRRPPLIVYKQNTSPKAG
ncbi:hypothetical protein V6N13_089837 [Hibiscus sabdariffa]